MASRVLLIWEDTPGSPECYRFDWLVSFTHEGITEITEHPVEDGSSITDHAIPQNPRFSLEGKISNTPTASNEDARIPNEIPGVIVIPTPPSEFMDVQSVELDIPQKGFQPLNNPIGQGLDLAAGAITGATGGNKATLFRAESPRNRAREMYEALKRARVDRRILRVETELETYQDMLIERVASPKTSEDGKTTLFQVDLRQIRIVNSRTVAAPQPAEPLGQPPIARGSQNTKEDARDSTKKEKLKKSLAAQGLDSLTSALGF